MKKTYRWGILGLGNIANLLASDLKDIEGAHLYAVASRSIDKAKAFAHKHDAQIAYDAYEDLIKDPQVDVIYIATPHVFHAELSLLCLQEKKAVLCEKPIAMNANQFKKVMEVAQQNSCFLMEGLWTNFMPHLKKVVEMTNNQTFGRCLRVEADFSFEAKFDANKRLFNKDLGGGALLDIGIYPVYLALKLLGVPDRVKAKAEFSSTGVDKANQTEFLYASGAKAQLSSSFVKTTPSQAKVYFEHGTISFGSRFHETDKLTIESKAGKEHFDFEYPENGYQFEIEHVQDCLDKGLTQSPEMPLLASLELLQTLDRIRKEVGLIYDQDL